MSSLLQGIRNGSCLSSNTPNTFSVRQQVLQSAEDQPSLPAYTFPDRGKDTHLQSSLPLCLCPGRADNCLSAGLERDSLRAGVEGLEKGATFGRQ